MFPATVRGGEIRIPAGFVENAKAGSSQATKTSDAKGNDRDRKRSVAELAMYVVGGIAAIGIVLIVGVLVWGAKIRRQARNERLEPQPHDPLWYLKTRKRPVQTPGEPNPLPPPDETSDSESPST